MACVDPFTGHQLWAEDYDESPNPLLALEQRELSKLLPSLNDLSFADVACGTGRWMSYALGLNARPVVGVDFSPKMLQRAARKPELSGKVILANASEIPLRTSSIDVLICGFALGYFQELNSIAGEFQRILKPGGFLFCSDFHPFSHWWGWKRSFKRDGIGVEIKSTPHQVTDVLAAFDNRFRLGKKVDLSLGESERPFFERAGKLEVFHQVEDIPAVILFEWQKRVC